MVLESEVEGIARLADIRIPEDDIAKFTKQFNDIIDYFDILDMVDAGIEEEALLYNIFRDDEVEPSLDQEDVISNSVETEEGFIRAPRVM